MARSPLSSKKLLLVYLLALAAIVTFDSMTLELLLPDTVHVGQPVPIVLRVTNESRIPASLYSQGRPTAFDIVISPAGGGPVWHRLRQVTITSVLQVRVLAPGEVLEFSDTWHQQDDLGRQLPPGDYQVVGVLPTDPPDQLRSRPEILRIIP